MQITKKILAMIFLSGLFVGCSTTGSIKIDTNVNDIKTISVLTFTCPDPVIADNVRNMIIGSLLTNYSVVIGDAADVVIKGTITLSRDQVSTASPGPATDYISEIHAQIIKNNNILDYAVVTQVSANSSITDPPEIMGRKIGEKIIKILSNIPSSTP